MLAFIDESGDAGLKIESGSSKIFVIAVVVFEDEEEATAVEQRIRLLRHELGFQPYFEFKFNKCKSDIRLAFLKAIAPYNFFYYGIVINKPALFGEGFKHRESFYKYATQLLLLNAREHLEDATINIDASGEREFRRQFNNYLKAKINSQKKHIRHVRFLDSKNNALIQMADMVAGSIFRLQGDKVDAETYLKVIRHREGHVQIWPKTTKPKS